MKDKKTIDEPKNEYRWPESLPAEDIFLFEKPETTSFGATQYARYYIKIPTGRVYKYVYHFVGASFSLSVDGQYNTSSYEELLEAANEEEYKKLQGINETNWKSYIDKLKR